jgi:hypothetical protein
MIAFHKKASTTTQSKLAEYIKGATKGKGSIMKSSTGFNSTKVKGTTGTGATGG